MVPRPTTDKEIIVKVTILFVALISTLVTVGSISRSVFRCIVRISGHK
jgi:hypothetical protein